jgi:ankyrin repeat protein
MAAASSNRIDLAKLLIEHGADVNQRSVSGLTALHYAALENNDEMAKLLLKNKADVDPTMHYSSTDGNFDKEPKVFEYIGATPLLIAVESGNIEVLKVLIKAGANPKHILIKNEYYLNENRASYLTGSEVMGIDKDFLKEVEFNVSDKTWSPFKQALLSNDPSIMTFFK